MQPNSKEQPISVVVLSDPGYLRDSLRTLICAVPSVQVVGLASLTRNLPAWVIEKKPDCVILESTEAPEPGSAARAALITMKRRLPNTRRLVIAGSPSQAPAYLAAGADCVLIRGFTLGELKFAIGNTYPENSQETRPDDQVIEPKE